MAGELIPGPNLLVWTPPVTDSSNKPASTEFVVNFVAASVSTGAIATAIASAARTAVGFSVNKGGVDQVNIPDASFTTVTWPTEVYDVGSYFASDVWTPPAGKIFLVAAVLVGGTIATGNQCSIAIYKNGADYKQGNWPSLSNVGTGLITIEDNANGTDTYGVALYIDLTSGSGTIQGDTKNTYYMGHWLGN